MTAVAAAPGERPAPAAARRRAFRYIVAHEWRLLARERLVWWLAAILVVLSVVAVANGRAWTGFQHRTLAGLDSAMEARRAKLLVDALALPPDARPATPFAPFPLAPGPVGQSLGAPIAALPPQPLAALAVGQSDLLPYYFTVTTRGRQAVFGASDELENPGNLLTGRFDLAFVVVVLLPLLILGLTYDMLAREREDGTLALLLAQPVGVGTLLAGKVIARLLLVVTLVIATVAAGIAATGAPVGDPEQAARAVAWLGVVLAYAGVWFALALVVSTIGRHTATNAVVLATAWLGFALVLPFLLQAGANALHPMPSRVALVSAMREASNAAAAQGEATLRRFYADHPELAPSDGRVDMGDFMARTYAVQDQVERSLDPVYDRFAAQVAAQQAVVARGRSLSPALVAYEALTELSGTGPVRHAAFMAQTEAFHGEWQARFIPRILRRQLLSVDEVRTLPVFVFREPATSDVVARAGAAIALLAAIAGGLTVLAAWRLRRFAVVA